MGGHALVIARSRALHTAVAERLKQDPTVLAMARRRVDEWLQTGSVAKPYAAAWAQLLAGPRDELLSALTDASERMHDLRQVSPFAGAISAQERWRIHAAVKHGVTDETDAA